MKHKKSGKRVSVGEVQQNQFVVIILFFVVIVLLCLAVGLLLGNMVSGREKKLQEGSQTEATATIAPSPTPSFVPTPTEKPTAVPTKKPAAKTVVGCDRFSVANGPVVLTVNLVSNSGTVTGDTVIRLKPSGSCAGESGAIEHWMKSGETSWTTPGVNPGKYRLEVANGNYQGVIVQTIDMISGRYVLNVRVLNR